MAGSLNIGCRLCRADTRSAEVFSVSAGRTTATVDTIGPCRVGDKCVRIEAFTRHVADSAELAGFVSEKVPESPV